MADLESMRAGNRPTPGTSLRSGEGALVGRSLGGFHLAHEIASGGMASLYLAHRLQHGRVGQVAAVKVIQPHLACNADFIDMFLDEARILASITHPNVCRALDFGRSKDTYYLAMEYVMGESLAELLLRLSSSPTGDEIAVPLLTHVMYQVCEGLHAVHEACDPEGRPLQVVHRDISPQNVMIGYDGCVRLVDFGVARAAERLHVTRTGVVKGRLCYMAPEQMRGFRVDRRADLWAVGVMLWEGLTQRRLFKRDGELETIYAVTLEPIPPIRHLRRKLPAALAKLVARALQRDPEQRYPNARELGVELLRSTLPHAPASVSDVSSWMHALFEDSIARKRELLRLTAVSASAARSGDGDFPVDGPGRVGHAPVRVTVPGKSSVRAPRGEESSSSQESRAVCVADPSKSGVRPTSRGAGPDESPTSPSLRRSTNSSTTIRRITTAVTIGALVALPQLYASPVTEAHVAARTETTKAATNASRIRPGVPVVTSLAVPTFSPPAAKAAPVSSCSDRATYFRTTSNAAAIETLCEAALPSKDDDWP